MPLMHIHSNLLIDPESLTFVRFENMDQDPTVFLRFKDGSSETVTGEAAALLQERLNSPQPTSPETSASHAPALDVAASEDERTPEEEGTPGPFRQPDLSGTQITIIHPDGSR